MDFADELEQVAGRVEGQMDYIEEGQSTKQTFVVPFIEALGYDTYDPNEVAPEFTVDTGAREEEIIDYAILQGGTPAFLIDCKPAGAVLSPDQAAPLLRVLQATEARVGILTNGVEYHFYADRQTAGEGPFFEFNLLGYTVLEVEALERLRKSTLDLADLISRMYESKTPALDDDDGPSGRDSGSGAGGSSAGETGGVLEVFTTVVGGIVTTVKVVAGATAFIVGALVVLFIVVEIYDEDGGATAKDFVKRRSQILETVESDLRAGRFKTAMDTADTYLEHVQDSTLQALRDEAEWAWRHDVDAWNACTDAVRTQLERPSQADFPQRVLADTIAYLRDRRFRIRAPVDPNASSERTDEVPFTCVVGSEAGEGWTIESLDVSAR